jgi:aryl-alcohol dehydrogenase-like predicted oxidoreductase
MFILFNNYSRKRSQLAIGEYVTLAKSTSLDLSHVASTLLCATKLEQLKPNIDNYNVVLGEDMLQSLEEIHPCFTIPAPEQIRDVLYFITVHGVAKAQVQ